MKRDIHDLIDEWHDGTGEVIPLHVFLGLTWDEYADWVNYHQLPEGCGLYDPCGGAHDLRA